MSDLLHQRKPLSSSSTIPIITSSRVDPPTGNGGTSSSPKFVANASSRLKLTRSRTSHHRDLFLLVLILLLSSALRFTLISHPPSVVFDEVHFGKFASYYLRREYFFDVHPPLAKLILAATGWVIGYDGHCEFENIGDSYVANKVNYVGLRAVPALLGSLVPGVVFGIMRESGYPRLIAFFSAALVILDNAHVAQTRLILLDAPLILFMTLSLYSYIRFSKLRYREFSKPWWGWLSLTGVFLSLTISCKMVGLFAFLTVGTAVVVDLWGLLDIRRGHSISHVLRHFYARVISLILLPSLIYLFWFYIHFKVLDRSGTGDDFMSPAFQETLRDSPLVLNSEEIRYFDTITLQHRTTKAYLHSHFDKYPLKYDDGRISSAGQQVTGYPFIDLNNHWIVEPTKPLPDTGRGRVVRTNDIITLRHLATNSTLLTHDVACPTLATNTEFTTYTPDPSLSLNELAVDPNHIGKVKDTYFKLKIDDAHPGQQWMSKSSHFQLVHEGTKVAMWTHNDPPLPEWGYKQQEVNGNKNLKDRTTFWVVDEIVKDPNATDLRRSPQKEQKKLGTMSFARKFLELQIAMLQHNAGLTDSHPYATGPINWPFLLSGISFWTGAAADKEQVYMIGNPISWWICVMGLSVYVGILGADQLAKRRGTYPIPEPTRNRLYNSGGFFFLAWLFHYFPFFTMSRQLFLHHYLPAHLCSALLAGAVLHFVFTETINYPISIAGPTTRRRPRTEAVLPKKAYLIVAVLVVGMVAMFWFLKPLTYGWPGLEPDEVNRRRILSSWTLHYAK